MAEQAGVGEHISGVMKLNFAQFSGKLLHRADSCAEKPVNKNFLEITKRPDSLVRIGFW